ncbi:phospholipase D-like domain-containing protein [Arenibacter lacus]|uniref:phospholipase D-like domain-containing protein n=1 Tax=Arenibacter lacus TaxID=2608629 RepID=UPI00123E1733|nr:phospholipase D-like domain-containing protein [Arenibacter lacus]
MAKYLDTSHISSELMELLKEAKERIILVTYSLQVNTQIQERLKTKSKLGTLGEITLIYGNTKPKQSELAWMSDIDDLKVFQKKNLHAKCYINEKKAIICSMNLYEYSQTTNVEMGILITKEEDPEAYEKMMEDIYDLRINGERVKPWLETDIDINNGKSNESVKIQENFQSEINPNIKSNLSYEQQIKKKLLQFFRHEMSTQLRRKSESILSDSAIDEIISVSYPTKAHLKKIFNSDKKVKQIGEELLYELELANDYVIGQVTDTRYQSDEFTYDQIKMKALDNGSEAWYDTKKELPKKGSFVGVRLNNNWFNSYLILEESTAIINITNNPSRRFKNGELKLTKDLSSITGLSSRDINSTLVSFGLMEKKGNDWFATKKGEKLGAQVREGQYGKFVVWPEQILEEIQLN